MQQILEFCKIGETNKKAMVLECAKLLGFGPSLGLGISPFLLCIYCNFFVKS